MNDKDKEEFEKWCKKYFSSLVIHDGLKKMIDDFHLCWKTACEYKQKEIDILNHDIAGYKEGIYCLESENKKLREALECYARGNYDT